MAITQTIHVSHLGGIDVGYQMPRQYDSSKPTLIMVNSFTTSADLYKLQFANKELAGTMNLLAIELLGHGETRTATEHFTYWDTAIMNLQVMDALKIPKAFILGTSQGGWVTARMALLSPSKIQGIIVLGTSMDYESERSRKLGCWDGAAACSGPISVWSISSANDDFEVDDGFCTFLVDAGFGPGIDSETRSFWEKKIKENYRGEAGRKRARMAAINLSDRDGLHGRVGDVRCPVLWMHGTEDQVYSFANAEEEIGLFKNSREATLVKVDGGQHFLSASHPQNVDPAVLQFVQKWKSN